MSNKRHKSVHPILPTRDTIHCNSVGTSLGITLREHFAGQALIGLIAKWGDEYTPEGFAEQAVKMADALCDELALNRS